MTRTALPAITILLLMGAMHRAFAANMPPVLISTQLDLENAIKNQQDGQTWLIQSGNYGLAANPSLVAGGQGGWFFPITANNLTIIGQGNPVIYGNDTTVNGAWASQDLIAVFGDNCTIKGLTLMPTYAENKTVEVIGAVSFSISNCSFLPSIQSWGDPAWGGSVYVNGAGMAAANNKINISQNTFTRGLVAFDGAAAKSIRVEDNTFIGIAPGGYAIGNTYWGGESGLTAAYSEVCLGGNAFVDVVPHGDPIIKARLTQTFRMDMDFHVNGAKVRQDAFGDYIVFDGDSRYSACVPTVIVGGTAYTR